MGRCDQALIIELEQYILLASMEEIAGRHFGVGVDIIELARFRRMNFPDRVAELFLTPREYEKYSRHPDRVVYAASRFALKEAVIKAFPRKLTYRDIEIVKEGRKPIALITHVRESVGKIYTSLAHSTDYVAGFAVYDHATLI